MNQISFLVNEIIKVKEFSRSIGGCGPLTGWKNFLKAEDDFFVRYHVNNLQNIVLALHESLRIEAEINEQQLLDQSWIIQTLDALNLYGEFRENLSRVTPQSLEYLRMSARTWQHGFEVRSVLDEEKVSRLVTLLEEERAVIIQDDNLSFDLKRVLVTELDKLIWALKKYSKVGDVLQSALKNIYGEVLLNPEVQNEFLKRSKLKDTIAEISSYITIGTAAYQYLPTLTQKAVEVLKLVNGND
ncbi:hypothetical protein [Acinetobacter sp. Marseille-Q1618]|uniref:hypothetical protein n=1 Tax=Acinetobacter sp. Marseille-Q1618 TaxID=2697502 RepID=UPI00156EBAD9|nr:hypothetical protein [Acinetobacter sp. Marseille-Q1618]